MFKKFAPGFLNRLDTYLLTKYPIIWISKIHYLLWFGLLLYVSSAIIGFLVPINLTSRADDGLWFVLLSVLAFILSWFWGYRYIIFNKEKNFGNLNFSDEYKNFLLVFFSIAIFAWFASPFVVSYNTKMAHLFTDDEVVQDINTLNETEPFVPTSYYSYENTYDTLKKQTYFNINKITSYNNYTPWRYLNDTVNFPMVLSNYKLLVSYKPSTDFNFVKSKVALHISICEKYGVHPSFNENEMAAIYIKAQKAGWMDVQEINFGNDYYKEEMRIAFNNLFEAKFGTLFLWKKDFLWGMFYFIFSLSLLLVLFKLNYWKQFLITMIVLALYPLFIYILSQILFKHSSAENAFQCFVFLLFVSSIISLFITAKNQTIFKPFFNVLNQLFFLLIIFMPMIIVNYLRRYTSVFHNYTSYNYGYDSMKASAYVEGQETQALDYNYYLDQYLYSYWQEEYDFWFMLCKWVPIILFIICLPFMKKLFVKQLALPRKT
ncbi:MAG: hypothetical protein Q7W45_11605 [Bacteroidota bacterium]|nr:hypothetical protein [Bacteroidota bacterium]MDP3147029.1 hypothetical protein [Bacteroidota bacterium]